MSGRGRRTKKIGLMALVVMLQASTAFSSFGPIPGFDPNMVLRWDPNQWVPSLSDWQARQAEEVYKKEGAEVVPWTRETALPSPDDAAILYYQAFLLRPEPDHATYLRINAVLGGAEPDRQVRACLGNCRATIHTAEIAAQVPQCTWGILYLDPKGFDEWSLVTQIRQLAFVLALDARTLGSDGHYEAALARCLTMHRLVRHVGHDTMLTYLVALALDSLTRGTMQHVLGLVPPDVVTLQLLRGQLTTVPGAPGSIQKAMQADLNLLIERLRNNAALLEQIRQSLAKNAGDQRTREQSLTPTDEDILARAREPYQRFLDSIFQVLG